MYGTVNVCECMCACVCMYACMYVCTYVRMLVCSYVCQRKLRSHTSKTIWRDEKQRRAEERRLKEKRERVKRKKVQAREMLGSRKTPCFSNEVGWKVGRSKRRLAKVAGAEPSGRMKHIILHGVVARSTFPSQKAQYTPRPDHFWQFRDPK